MAGATKAKAIQGLASNSSPTGMAPFASTEEAIERPLASVPNGAALPWQVSVEMNEPVPVLARELELIEFHFAELLDTLLDPQQ